MYVRVWEHKQYIFSLWVPSESCDPLLLTDPSFLSFSPACISVYLNHSPLPFLSVFSPTDLLINFFFYYYDYFCQMAQLSLYCRLLTYSTDFRQTCARWKKIEEDKPPSLICLKWFPDSQPISLSPSHAQNNAMSILGYQSILSISTKLQAHNPWLAWVPNSVFFKDTNQLHWY